MRINNILELFIIVPQKNAYEVARRIGILVSALTVKEINNKLLYS